MAASSPPTSPSLVRPPFNASFTIHAPELPQNISTPSVFITPTAATLTCIVTEITLDPEGSSTGANFSYQWNETPYTDLTPIIIDFPGDYTLVVTDDSNGCSTSAVVSINQDIVSPNITAQGGTLICADSEVTLSVSVSPANSQFVWVDFPGQTSPVVNNPGTYTVAALNPDNGCGSSAVAIVDALTPFLTLQPVSIAIDCDPVIEQWVVPAGGTPPYAYLWSNGSVSDTAYFNSGEIVSVTVTDFNGCSVSTDPVVVLADVFVVDATKTDESAQGAADGTATATVSGGSLPFSYQWNTGATTPVITNLEPGTYCVTVTSGNGCTQETCVTVSTTIGSNEPPAGWQVSIAPNPTTGDTWLNMRFAKPEDINVQVYDLTGRLIQQQAAGANVSEQRLKLDLGGQASGMYLVRVKAAEKAHTWRIVKE